MNRHSKKANGIEEDQTLLNGEVDYKAIVEGNEVGIFLLKNDTIQYTNSAFAEILDSTPDLLKGTSILNKVAKEDQTVLQTAIDQIVAGEKQSFSQDFELLTKDKNTAYFSLHLKVLSSDGKTVEIIGASRNATSRVLKSIELDKTKSKYEALFRNIINGVIIYDYSLEKTIDFNDAALRILEFEGIGDLLNHTQVDYIPKTSDFFPGMDLHKVINSHAARVIRKESFSSPGVFKTFSGKHIKTNVNIVPTLNKPGEAYVMFEDVTHLHQAKLDLNDKNEELQKYIDSNLQLENFAYFASHDLQTPLRSIISFTQLLQRRLKGKVSGEEQEYMDYIVSGSKNMRDLINDLLSYSRVNTAKINLTSVSVTSILKDLCNELENTIKEKNAEVEIKYIPDSIFADATKIRQVFQNLITNALKFSRPDVNTKITIDCAEKKKHWLFSVKDNGIGILPEYQDKIFLLFKRLHGNADYEGTGIGLAMVKKIIEQHEGEIWLDSEEGLGSTFWFKIAKLGNTKNKP